MNEFKNGFLNGCGNTLGVCVVGVTFLLTAHLVLMIQEKISKLRRHSN